MYQNLGVKDGFSAKNIEGFYVPIHEDTLKKLETRLDFSTVSNDTIFLMGQTGSGKTTCLNYLTNRSEIVTSRFDFVSIDFLDPQYGLDFTDKEFDLIEMYVDIFYNILKFFGHNLSKDYVDKLVDKLKELEDKKNVTEITEQKNTWSLAGYLLEAVHNIGFGMLGIKWSLDASTKESIRKTYKTKIVEFLNILNDLCTKVDSDLQQRGKNLLLILDGLEKITDVAVIDKIFNAVGINNLKNILSRKIVVTPVHLSALEGNTLNNTNDEFLISLKIFDNPLTSSQKQFSQIVQHNKELLKQVLVVRIAEDQQLIDQSSIELAIEKSGGFLYDFTGILQNAIINAQTSGSAEVHKEHVKTAIADLEFKKSGSFTFDSQAIRLLYHVLKSFTTPEGRKDNVFTQQVLRNNLIITKNDVRCYFVHPLIQKTVEVYGKSLTEASESE